jgi:hypothetical protein
MIKLVKFRNADSKKKNFPPQTNVHVQFCVHTLKKIHQYTTTNVKLKLMTIVSFRQLLE